MSTLLQQVCRAIQAPATTKRYRDAGVGLVFILVNQAVVLPIQIMLDVHSINVPASILVMLLFAFLMVGTNFVYKGTTSFYYKHLRGPTDFLGRHMSFGFVAPFIMLNRDHITNAIDAPKITGAFVITTLAGYVATSLVAMGCYKLEYRLRGRRPETSDIETNTKSWPSPSTAWPAPPTDRSPQTISRLPQISTALVLNGSLSSIGSAKRAPSLSLVDHLVRTAPLWTCVFLIVTVGLPAYFAADYDGPCELLSFLLFWVLAQQLLKSLKDSCRLLRSPRMRSIIIVFANPVVVTWVLGTAYLGIKAALTEQPIGDVVSEFRRHDTLAESIINIAKGGDIAAHIGAGDLSGAVLDAGIACLGFKMFQYRKELWESFVTVFMTCAVLTVANVFFSVFFARTVGLQTEDATAFAARSVTIALGVPAVQNLHGSTTLMSALVIFGGIVFQMAGDWAFSLLRIKDRADQTPTTVGLYEREKDGIPISAHIREQRNAGYESRVIAAGVTVGINAAAMGTSHLIERDSKAVAYSALSMTVFGAMTVALTAVPGVSRAITTIASR
ncbi:hypothetical protein F4677DRAFT_384107 [Hypoxylon crocopeplum]|nr:hypothetical protein F4677DRAFT_384107 [Hypoxylon crocopeplum]